MTDKPASLDQVWSQVSVSFPSHFGENVYNSWLKHLAFYEDQGNRLVLSVPSSFIRDWIMSRYSTQILPLLQQQAPQLHNIDIIVDPSAPAQPMDAPPTVHTEELAESPDLFMKGHYTGTLDARYTFENFIVGKPNELAYAAARRVAESDTIFFNPLFLYGGVGLGKTHLMHGIAWHIHQHRPNRKVIYMSAEKFMYQFVRALRLKDIISFREQFRSVDVLMIDDVQFISGKDSTQEEFFHTFNALVDQKKQIVLSADKSPSDLQGIEERMRSRLGWGLVADIHPTTYELRLGILQAKAEKLEHNIPMDVIEFLAHKITSNIRELEGALNRIVAHASLVGSVITLDMVQNVLRDLLRANERYVTVEEIQRQVADYYNVRASDMHSDRRLRVVARPRQVAMYLSKKLTSKSLPEIGRKFGGRDHTTVMHAVKRIEELHNEDPSIRKDLEMLERLLGS